VKPVEDDVNNTNLTVETEATVKKLLLRKTAPDGAAATGSPVTAARDFEATGVEYYNKSGGVTKARAKKGVILSSGAIGSPHLLQVSGIGDRSLSLLSERYSHIFIFTCTHSLLFLLLLLLSLLLLLGIAN
jgi:hypothetical protein